MSRIRRAVTRKHRNKYLAAGFVGLLGSAPQLASMLEGKVSALTFAAVTVGAFALAGISQVMGDGD